MPQSIYSTGFARERQTPTYRPDVEIRSTQGVLVCNHQHCKYSKDRVAQKLDATINQIYQFFHKLYGLQGIDNKGTVAPLCIHWTERNAAWTGQRGNAPHVCNWKFHDEYVSYPEVVAHEYVHGIIARLRPLNYHHEPGALDESLADCFGLAFKHWITQDEESWKIANFRDISQHYDRIDFKQGRDLASEDFGYVHDNSLIPSHAFYVSVKLTESEAYGPISQIWFRSMSIVTPEETFASFATKTIRIAQRDCSENVTRALYQAWFKVKVLCFSPSKPIPTRQFEHLERPFDRHDAIHPTSREEEEVIRCVII